MLYLSFESVERSIYEASDWHKLRTLRDTFQAGFEAQLIDASTVTDYRERLNLMHDTLIQRAVRLAEEELKEEGQGAPPVPYSFVLFGSGGRSEQTLWSDQDNGLIYDDAEACGEPEAVDRYFSQLALRIRTGLELLGYPPCEGDVICTNARWCKPLSRWRDMLDEWVEEPCFDHIRYMLIVADMRSVYGDRGLCRKVKERLYEVTEAQPMILQAMVNNTLRHKVLIGPFGNLLRERYGVYTGAIDIKYGSYIPMVNGIRMLAIRESIDVTSTLGRLGELRQRRIIGDADVAAWQRAFELNLRLRLMAVPESDSGLLTSTGKIMVHRMTREEVHELKEALRIGRHLRRYVQRCGARR